MYDHHETQEYDNISRILNPLPDNEVHRKVDILSAENSRLRLQLEEAQAKIQRLINQADEGEEL